MARRRAFDMCHPSVNLLYFLLVLVCSVGCMHPACLGISLGGALACGLLFRGRRAVGRPAAMDALPINFSRYHAKEFSLKSPRGQPGNPL